MEKLQQFIRSRSLREMLQELAWLSRYSLHYKKEVLWYIFIGILEISHRIYRIRHDRIIREK